MRILFVCENFYPFIGGAETVFLNLAQDLVASGHEVTVVTHKIPGSLKFEEYLGIKIHRVSCFDNRYLFPFFALGKVMKLAKDFDVIQTTTFTAAPCAWLVSKLRHKPVVLTVHEVWIGKWQEKTTLSWFSAFMHDVFERMIYWPRYTHYVCVSESTQGQLNPKLRAKSSVVYNGVDYSHWDPAKHQEAAKKIRSDVYDDSFALFASGRPGTSKGLSYLIEAMPAIVAKIPTATLFLMMSKGAAYQKNYQEHVALIKKLDMDKHVTVLEPVSYAELPAYSLAANCVVVPSLGEGFGFAVAESCALGVPVVASDVDSIPEVISGKHVLVSVKNSDAIAAGVLAVFEKRYEETSLKQFTQKDNTAGYLNVYATYSP